MGPGLTPERSGVIGAAQAQPNEPASKSVVAYRIIRTPSSFGHSHYHVRPAFRGLIGLCRNVSRIPPEGKNSLGGEQGFRWRIELAEAYTTIRFRGFTLIKDDSKPGSEDFFPRGAITFFAVMIAVFGLIWLGMYALLLHRHRSEEHTSE